jgi:hypothetical protein
LIFFSKLLGFPGISRVTFNPDNTIFACGTEDQERKMSNLLIVGQIESDQRKSEKIVVQIAAPISDV